MGSSRRKLLGTAGKSRHGRPKAHGRSRVTVPHFSNKRVADSNYITPSFPSWQHFRYKPDENYPGLITYIGTWNTKFEYILLSISLEGSTDQGVTVYRVSLRLMNTLPPYNRTTGLTPVVGSLYADIKEAMTFVHQLKAEAESYAVAFVI